MIIGGGVSKSADKYIPRLTVRCPVVPAQLRNDAGIIGAAIVAAEGAHAARPNTDAPSVPLWADTAELTGTGAGGPMSPSTVTSVPIETTEPIPEATP